MSPLLFKRLKIEGSTLRSRDLNYQSNLVQNFVKCGGVERIVAGISQESKLEAGHHLAIHKVSERDPLNRFCVITDMQVPVKVFSWTQIKEAHDEMEKNLSEYERDLFNIPHC